MILGIGMGAAVALTVLAVRVAKQPDAFRIERSITIAAPAQAIFSYLNDFHRWPAWSPYVDMDPNMQTTYSGAPAGVGAVYEWTGNKKVGAGKMTIREVTPDRRVGFDLHFTRPMPANNVGEFVLEPAPGGVRVTWATNGTNNLLGKLFSLAVDVDKMVGKDFEKGLATLKRLCEAQSSAALSAGATN